MFNLLLLRCTREFEFTYVDNLIRIIGEKQPFALIGFQRTHLFGSNNGLVLLKNPKHYHIAVRRWEVKDCYNPDTVYAILLILQDKKLKKSRKSKEIRLKFRDEVKMTEIMKKKRLKKISSPKKQKTKKRYEKKRKYKEIVDDVDKSYSDESEEQNLEAQDMNYAGVETSPQQFSPTVDKNLGEKQDGTKGCTDLHPDKTNVEIDSQHLIPDELLQSINLDYNLSEKIVHYDVLIVDEKMDGTNLSDS
ncbi:hypothetical protein FXO37_12174 [Capsicum annuum]|nr:hypothetical protein FXO37_12174 [Capsicum annuum]